MAYKPHERIWLQCYGDGDPEYDGPVDFDEMYWCQDKVNEHDVGYVRVDALEALQEQAHQAECFPCLPLWEKFRHIIGVPRKSKAGKAKDGKEKGVHRHT